jgi:uncharacterized membrane protein YeaQ/YmgE (transglycosylase-associated protein family)
LPLLDAGHDVGRDAPPSCTEARMTILGFLLLLLIGAICGAIAEVLVGYSPGGLLASIGVGFLGALLGGWIASAIGLPEILAVQVETVTIPILWAVLGAVILLAVLAALRRSFVRRRAL